MITISLSIHKNIMKPKDFFRFFLVSSLDLPVRLLSIVKRSKERGLMLEFLKEYVQHPFTIGAVAPSSRFLANRMVQPINFNECNCIVEYGPGTGIFTKEIIKRKQKHTIFLIIEQNEEFYHQLVSAYGKEPGVTVIHGKAEEVETYLKEMGIASVDYVVSGLPFASLPKEVSSTILEKTKQIVGPEGRMITFQYTMFKRHMFERFFRVEEVRREYRNFPPAYVLVMGDTTC